MRETKIVVRLSAEVKARIEDYAGKMGISQSAYCAYVLGSHINTQDQLLDTVPKLQATLLEAMKNAIPVGSE